MTPCNTCAMLIIQCGIKQIHCLKHYPHANIEDDVITMFKSAGVSIDYKYNEEAVYE